MKKAYFIVILFFIIQEASACTICGCSSGSYFIGPFPQFRKHFIGTRYTFRSFHSRITNDPHQYSKDFYQTIELWGGFNVGSKWQILAFLPYSMNHQVSDDGVKQLNGLGDMTIIANYNLFTKTSDQTSQLLWIGGGIKLPTGKFSLDQDDLVPSANSQPGSGSVDFLMNALYALRLDKWGINSSVSYKINQSASTFQFGNRFNASAFAFRSIPESNVTFNPNMGLLYENLKPNKQGDVRIEDTGGYALLGAMGLETNFSKIAVGFNVQLPINQKFSSGQTSTNVRGMIHVTYTF